MNVKDISIKSFLADQDIIPTRERTSYGMYLSPFRTETAPSFKVDYTKNLWFDFGTGEGGSIIDLVMKLDGCSVGKAIGKLEHSSSFSFHRVQSVAPTQSTLRIVSVEPLQNPNLLQYVQHKRHTNLNIAKECCREVHYTVGEKRFYAIGFQSDAGGWELRNEYFKGSTSPKSPTTIRSGSPTCLLFEGFMDMLSYLTLKREVRPVFDMVVLNSVHNLHRAEEFLKQHKTVLCLLDNDQAGQHVLKQVKQLGMTVVDHSAAYLPFKDLNEYLCHKVQQTQVHKTK